MRKTKRIIAILLTAGIFFSGFAAEVKNEKAAEKKTSSNTKVEFVQNLQNILETGDLDKAIAYFDSLSASDSQDANLMLIKSSLLISAGKIKEASVTELCEADGITENVAEEIYRFFHEDTSKKNGDVV